MCGVLREPSKVSADEATSNIYTITINTLKAPFVHDFNENQHMVDVRRALFANCHGCGQLAKADADREEEYTMSVPMNVIDSNTKQKVAVFTEKMNDLRIPVYMNRFDRVFFQMPANKRRQGGGKRATTSVCPKERLLRMRLTDLLVY